MISTYRQLAFKYLAANKKQTFLTITGVILSLALITTTGLFLYSLKVTQRDYLSSRYGAFHLLFNTADKDLLDKVNHNPQVATAGLWKKADVLAQHGDNTVSLERLSTTAFSMLNVQIRKGRMPQKATEVIAPEKAVVIPGIDTHIGAVINAKGMILTITGTYRTDLFENARQCRLLGICDTTDLHEARLLVAVKPGDDMQTTIWGLEKAAPAGSFKENAALVEADSRLLSSALRPFAGIAAIVLFIVFVSTILVIYNVIRIGIVRRVRQLGLLKAVGASPQQIRKLVFLESAFLALMGIPPGLLCGILAMYGIRFAFNDIGGGFFNETMRIVIPSPILGISTLIGVSCIYFSSLLPAAFAGRLSPLIAISTRTFIIKEKIRRKGNLLTKAVQRIFGFEGTLALKNMKRNPGQYRVTMSSFVISVSLFITFGSFMDLLLESRSSSIEQSDRHFVVSGLNALSATDTMAAPQILQAFKGSAFTGRIMLSYSPYYFTMTTGRQTSPTQGALEAETGDDLAASSQYLTAGSLDTNSMDRENGVAIVRQKNIRTDLAPGDSILLQFNGVKFSPAGPAPTGFNREQAVPVRITAVLEGKPFSWSDSKALKIITTQKVAQRLTGLDIRPNSVAITLQHLGDADVADVAFRKIIQAYPSLSFSNTLEKNKQKNMMILLVRIILFGLASVIALIGMVNIVNTVTTNIILRRREFAALGTLGVSPKGLYKMILLEGLLYGISGIVNGSVAGIIISFLMYLSLRSAGSLHWHVPWTSVLIAGGGALLAGYVSVLAPLQKIRKQDLIAAIREE